MALATVAQVESATGIKLSQSKINHAQMIIEMFTNRTEAASGDMSTRDLNYLKLAVAYQAVYMDAHPEVMSIMDVNSLNQGGLGISFKTAEHTLLAPLARMSIRKLSWMRNRTLHVNSDLQNTTVDYDEAQRAIEDEDDSGNWEQI